MRKHSVVGSSNESRLLVLFIVIVALILVRLTILTILDAPALAAQSQSQRSTPVDIPARRGTIFDRNGNPLAMSIDATTIYVNPSEVEDPRATAQVLHEVLGGSVESYLNIIMNSTSPTFAYILQKGDVSLARSLQERNDQFREAFIDGLPAGDDIPAIIPTPLTGIHYIQDSKRIYPYGRIGAQVIGSIDIDGYGISGVEQTYDSILRGVDGSMLVERGKDDTPMVGGIQQRVMPIDGQDIIISIDIELQQFVENNLELMCNQRSCVNGSAIMLDGATGEIWAAASMPLYDRGNLTQEAVEAGATNLRPIVVSFEPGSIFKTVTAAAAIECNVIDLDDELFCPAYITIDDYPISDAHDRDDEIMTFRQILAKSSNVGMSLIEEQINNERFSTFIERYGFGQYTHIDYPGESPGLVAELRHWSSIQAANMSFGQGLQITPLQIASFYGAIANEGMMCQPHFLIARPRYDAPPHYESKPLFGPKTAAKLEDLLSGVVIEGTGKPAAIPGYDVVGKTGTAEIASPLGGYLEDEYIVSFVGYIANSNSKLVCVTSLDSPIAPMDYPAASVLFNTIMSFAINRYMVVPVEESSIQTNSSSGTATAGPSAAGTTTGQDVLPQEGTITTTPSIPSLDSYATRPESWIIDTSG